MPVYRYKQGGIDEDDLKEQVPPADASSLSAGTAAMERYFDITALATSKDDLDTFMTGLGWTFDSTDPSTTPSEASETSSSGAGIQPQSHRSASADPTVDDDSGDGYAVGSYWINTTTDEAFICLDASSGAAVWKSLTPEDVSLPAVQARRTTTYTVTNAWVDITLSTADVETDSAVLEWDTSNTDRILVKEDGVYLVTVTFSVDFSAVGSFIGNVSSRMRVNDSTVIDGSSQKGGNYYSSSSANDEELIFSQQFLADLTASDYLTLQLMYTAGVASAIIVDSGLTITVTKLQGATGPQGIAGSGSSITVKDSGVNVPNTPHTALDFVGNLAASDAGSGVAEISLVVGSQFDEASSEGESSTTSATYVQKLRLTTASVPAGDYYISWYYEHAMGGDDKQFGFRVQIDDTTTISEGIIECKGQYVDSQWRSQSGMYVATLTATTHDIDIDYADISGDTAYIRRARLAIWRVS